MADIKNGGNGEFYSSVIARLEAAPNAETTAELLTWLRDHHETGTPQEKLAVYKKLRDLRAIDEESLFYMIAWIIMMYIAHDKIMQAYDVEFKNVNAQIKAVKKAHGLDQDEDWAIGQGPDEYKQLSKEWGGHSR